MMRAPSHRCTLRTAAVAGAAVLVLGAAAPGPKTPPALLWPTDRTPALVSTFGEYRYDHLHAGIDISTGGGTGYPVRAAAAGVVYRLKVEWRGYGRALYLRHDDGRASVYGHLERFDEATLGLETRVGRRRAETGTPWPGDIFIDPPIAVKRGQVIAYSGESGVGLPHLHFEVRGTADDPIDPFRSGLVPPPDREPPIVESMVFTAATPETFLDGSWRQRTIPVQARGGAHEEPPGLVVDGPFLASVSAWDPAGGGRAGLRSVSLAIDGSSCYALEVPGFRFEQYPIAGLIFDHRFSHLGPTRMAWRLASLPGNVFAHGGCGSPGTPSGAPPGAIALGPGRHLLEVVVSDASGNPRRAAVAVTVRAPGEGETLPAATRAAGSTGGSAGPAVPRYFPGFVEFLLPASAGATPPDLASCGLDAPRPWRPIDGGAALGIALGYDEAAALGAALASGQVRSDCPLAPALASVSLDVARPGTPLRLDQGPARVEIPAGGRFYPGPVVLAEAPVAGVSDGLRPVGDAVDLLPDGESLDARGLLALSFDPAAEEARRLGVYRWDEVGRRWSFEGDEIDLAARSVSVLFRRYGRFALLADASPPTIGLVRPRAGAVTGGRPEISAKVGEVGKGLAWDGVSMSVDGTPVPAEFDPDRGVARPLEAPRLAPGRHHLSVRAVDRAGNASAPVEVDFSVKR
jgi:peptidase M23-like protein